MVERRADIRVGIRDETGAGLQSVQQNIQNTARQMSAIGRRMMVTGGVGITAIMGMVKAGSEFGTTMDKMTKQTDMSVESIQRLRYAMIQEHGDFEGFMKSMPIFVRRMREARDGNETYARTFRDMGVDVTDAEGNLRRVEDVILDLSDYFSDASVSAEDKMANAMELLGRRGAETIPFLSLGRKHIQALGDEAERYGMIMDREATEQAKAFGDEMTKLTETIKGQFRAIGIGLLPMLQSWVARGQRVAEWFSQLDPHLKGFIAKSVLIGSVLLVVGGGLLLVAGQGLMAVNSMINLAVHFGLVGTTGVASMGAVAVAMGKVLLITLALVGALEVLQSLWKFRGVWRTGRQAKDIGRETDEVKRKWEAGEITREEAEERFRRIQERGTEVRRVAGEEGFGATLGMRAWDVIQDFRGFQKESMEQIKEAQKGVPFGKETNINITNFGEVELQEQLNQIRLALETV